MPAIPSSVIKTYRTALKSFVVNLRARVRLVLEKFEIPLFEPGGADLIDSFALEVRRAVMFISNIAKQKSWGVINTIMKNAEYHAQNELKRLYGKDAKFFAPLPRTALSLVESQYNEELTKLGVDLGENITRAVRQAIIEGRSIKQLAVILNGVYRTGWTSAVSIARTESTRLWSLMFNERLKQMGADEWEWVTAGDQKAVKVCEICRPLNGKRFKIDSDVKLNNGKIVKHPPAHPHCRCGMRVVAPSQSAKAVAV